MSVNLCRDGIPKTVTIHKIIMRCCNIPNPLNKPNVDHKYRNTANNKLSNLRCATRSEQFIINSNKKEQIILTEEFIGLNKIRNG